MSPAVLECRFYRTAAKKIGHDILRVQWQWPLSMPLVGSFGKGLYEVRTSIGAREFRVLFCVVDGSMVLLHGFQKKTRATPATDIALARKRMTEDDDA